MPHEERDADGPHTTRIGGISRESQEQREAIVVDGEGRARAGIAKQVCG